VDANKETTVVTVETLDEACVIAAQPWRKLLPVHAAAELFPRMKGDELVALGEDIRRNGLRVAIVLIEVDQSAVMVQGRPVALLDGRNRLDALEATGHRINFQFYQDSVGRNYWTACGQEQIGVRIALVRPNDPHEFVLALNIRRRHLAAKQRRELISKLLRLTPEASDRQIAARGECGSQNRRPDSSGARGYWGNSPVEQENGPRRQGPDDSVEADAQIAPDGANQGGT